ncbi:Uncharacterized protein TCM_019972 [Theobroma cacao]|uniref:Uncharacterized protein n=1 Tax=Theobroma cacao TaxID=3641 RepID=A0A061EK71_THECC|nr:Uncharacterized protein TCM_019972 [Theobroma cacao]
MDLQNPDLHEQITSLPLGLLAHKLSPPAAVPCFCAMLSCLHTGERRDSFENSYSYYSFVILVNEWVCIRSTMTRLDSPIYFKGSLFRGCFLWPLFCGAVFCGFCGSASDVFPFRGPGFGLWWLMDMGCYG